MCRRVLLVCFLLVRSAQAEEDPVEYRQLTRLVLSGRLCFYTEKLRQETHYMRGLQRRGYGPEDDNREDVQKYKDLRGATLAWLKLEKLTPLACSNPEARRMARCLSSCGEWYKQGDDRCGGSERMKAAQEVDDRLPELFELGEPSPPVAPSVKQTKSVVPLMQVHDDDRNP